MEGKKERAKRKGHHNHSHKPTVEKRDAGDFPMKANLDRIVHVMNDNFAQLTHRLESEGVLPRGAGGRTSAVPSLASVSGWGRPSMRPAVSSSKDGMQFEGLLSTLATVNHESFHIPLTGSQGSYSGAAASSRASLLDTPRVWRPVSRARYSIYSIYLLS